MGDKVQAHLESFLPALLDLQKKNLFTKREIRLVVKKRRDFEYRCAGKQCTKKDFLDYVQYETALEALRIRRCGTAKLKSHATLSSSNLSHILRIFDRAVAVWPQDNRLWSQYIDCCLRAGATKQVLTVLSRALAQHPAELNFWLLSADRELKLGHLEAPRRLLQLALRQLPHCVQLWQESFRFEIRCLVKLITAQLSSGGSGRQPLGCEHLLVILNNGLQRLQNNSEGQEIFLLTSLDLLGALLRSPESEGVNLGPIEERLSEELEARSEKSLPLKFLVWKLKCLASTEPPDILLILKDLAVDPVLSWQCLLLLYANLLDDRQLGSCLDAHTIDSTQEDNSMPASMPASMPLFRLDSSPVIECSTPTDDKYGDHNVVMSCSKPRVSHLFAVAKNPLEGARALCLDKQYFESHSTTLIQALIIPTVSSSSPSIFSAAFPNFQAPVIPDHVADRLERERLLIRSKLTANPGGLAKVFQSLFEECKKQWDNRRESRPNDASSKDSLRNSMKDREDVPERNTICLCLPLLHQLGDQFIRQFPTHKSSVDECVNCLCSNSEEDLLVGIPTKDAANFLVFKNAAKLGQLSDATTMDAVLSRGRTDKMSSEMLSNFVLLEQKTVEEWSLQQEFEDSLTSSRQLKRVIGNDSVKHFRKRARTQDTNVLLLEGDRTSSDGTDVCSSVPESFVKLHKSLACRLDILYAACKQQCLPALTLCVIQQLLCKDERLLTLEMRRATQQRSFASRLLPAERQCVSRTIILGWAVHALESLSTSLEKGNSSPADAPPHPSRVSLANDSVLQHQLMDVLIDLLRRCVEFDGCSIVQQNGRHSALTVSCINPNLNSESIALRLYSVARCFDDVVVSSPSYISKVIEHIKPLIIHDASFNRMISTLPPIRETHASQALWAEAGDMFRLINLTS